MICLELNDHLTQEQYVVRLSNHDANKLYKALLELFGDSQFGAKPNELITMGNPTLNIGKRFN